MSFGYYTTLFLRNEQIYLFSELFLIKENVYVDTRTYYTANVLIAAFGDPVDVLKFANVKKYLDYEVGRLSSN